MSAKDRLPELPVEDRRNLAYRLDETYWGYIIRQRQQDGLKVDILQALAGLFGLGFVSAAVAVWVVPGSIVDGDVAVFKAVVSLMSCALGILLLWYAGAGRTFELQVDLTRRELREAMRNSKGRVRIGRRHPFEVVRKIIVHPDSENPIDAALMIGFHDSDLLVEVATAPEHQLYALRSRIARDISRGRLPSRDPRLATFLRGIGQAGTVQPVSGLRTQAQ